jgi:glycosyltransferase involved in cell wall biosynthesis
MCGTPVVAFRMGVSLDLVQDGETGYLAELGDAKGLCDGIQRVLDASPEDQQRMNRACGQASKALDFPAFIGKMNEIIGLSR